MNKEIRIAIDRDVLEEYYDYYFSKYKRRKVRKIKSPIPPSLNELLSMGRHAMNTVKKNWQEFGVWLVNKNGYNGLMINECDIFVDYQFGTLRRRDLDNVSIKALMDSFTESKMIQDDSYLIVKSITVKGFYFKNEPRTNIIIRYEEEN